MRSHSSAVQIKIVAGYPLTSHRAEQGRSTAGLWSWSLDRFIAISKARAALLMVINSE